MLLQTPKALYEQVKDHITNKIKSGAWPPDTRVPSENQLAKEFSVSRMTVNRALRELSHLGHIVRIQGVGTYVAKPKPMTALFEIISIDEEIKNNGNIYSCDVHLLQKENAHPELALSMEIAPGAPVYHSIVVHKSNGSPVMLSDRYVNPLSVPDYLKQDFTNITPSNYLLSIAPVSEVEHIVEAVLPDNMTMRLLKISCSGPCLVLHRKTWDGHKVVTHSKMTYPGSTYRLGGRFKPMSGHY